MAALAGIIIIVKAADVLTCYFNKKLCGGVYFEAALCLFFYIRPSVDRQPCRKLYKLAAEIKIKPSSKMKGDPTQDEPPGGGCLLFSKCAPIQDEPHFPFRMSAWLQHRQSLNQTKTNGLIHLIRCPHDRVTSFLIFTDVNLEVS